MYIKRKAILNPIEITNMVPYEIVSNLKDTGAQCGEDNVTVAFMKTVLAMRKYMTLR